MSYRTKVKTRKSHRTEVEYQQIEMKTRNDLSCRTECTLWTLQDNNDQQSTYNIAHSSNSPRGMTVTRHTAINHEKSRAIVPLFTLLTWLTDRVISAVETDPSLRVTGIGVKVTETSHTAGKFSPKGRVCGVTRCAGSTMEPQTIFRTRTQLNVTDVMEGLFRVLVARWVGGKVQSSLEEPYNSCSSVGPLKMCKN